MLNRTPHMTKVTCARAKCIMDVRKMREESKMTRQEFSEYLGIPRKTIRNWEQGATKPVSYLLTLMEKVLRYEGKID